MKLDHIALRVKDIKKSVNWYKNTMSATISYQDDTWAMLKIKNCTIALISEEINHPPHIAFSVNHVHEIPCDENSIKKHRDNSLYYYQSDPDGNIIEWIYWPKTY